MEDVTYDDDVDDDDMDDNSLEIEQGWIKNGVESHNVKK